MAEPVQEHEPKFNDIELIVGSIVLGIVDLIGIALIFIGLDDFFLMDLIVDPFLLWYYNHKGLLGTRMFTKAIWGQIIAELVPWLGDLPFYTIGFWVIFWIDRHPKIEALTEEAGMAIAAAEGAGAAGAAEGAAGAEAAAAGAEGAAAAGEAGVASAEGAAAGAEGAAAAGEAAEAAEGAEAAAGEGAEGAEGEKKGWKERAKDAYDQLQQGGPGEEGDEENPEEDGEDGGTPEKQELMDELSGNYIGKLIRTTMTPEEILGSIARAPEDDEDLKRRQAARRRALDLQNEERARRMPPPVQEGYNDSVGERVDLTN